jgi:hypothetical protein
MMIEPLVATPLPDNSEDPIAEAAGWLEGEEAINLARHPAEPIRDGDVPAAEAYPSSFGRL